MPAKTCPGESMRPQLHPSRSWAQRIHGAASGTGRLHPSRTPSRALDVGELLPVLAGKITLIILSAAFLAFVTVWCPSASSVLKALFIFNKSRSKQQHCRDDKNKNAAVVTTVSIPGKGGLAVPGCAPLPALPHGSEEETSGSTCLWHPLCQEKQRLLFCFIHRCTFYVDLLFSKCLVTLISFIA